VGIVLAFVVGYVVGANAGNEGYQEVLDSLRAVRGSDEFKGLVRAIRSHTSATLRQLGDLIDEDSAESLDAARLLDRVRTLVGRAGSTWPAS
jgi:hypothetical protein